MDVDKTSAARQTPGTHFGCGRDRPQTVTTRAPALGSPR